MLNSIILKIQGLPHLLLGFMAIIITLFILYYIKPPKTLCDIQMDAIQQSLRKGFYVDDRTGSFRKSVGDAFKFCLNSNSPGGCYDMFKRLYFFEKQIRTLPEECGSSEASLLIKKALEKALRLFAKIGWGGSPPENKYNKLSWLDSRDVGLYCRLKKQYQRLYGKETWNLFTWSVIAGLPKVETLKESKREIWERSLFSQTCKNF